MTRVFSLTTLFFALTACTVLPEPIKMTVHDLGPSQQKKNGDRLRMIKIDAPEWLWDNRIRYRLLYSQPSRVRFYSRNRWIAPAPTLLQHYLTLPERFSCVLDIRVQDFEQQFISAQQSQVVLNLSVALHSSSNKKFLARTDLQFELKASTADALGAVKGLTELSQQANIALDKWLSNQGSQYCFKQ